MNLSPFSCARTGLAGLALVLLAASAEAGFPFQSADPLAQRDEWGLLHQTRDLNEVDYLPRRYQPRFIYNLTGRNSLTRNRAYVGALQDALRRRGLYCGPIDGLFSQEVSDAIARFQKNSSMRVTGSLTVPVRRALYLP